VKNKIQHGKVLTFTAPAGGVISGNAYRIGVIFGIASISADAGQPFEMDRGGVYMLPKKAGEAWTEGEALYWDAATGVLTATEGVLPRVAAAVAAVEVAAAVGPALILPPA
jgi:predicted RecA/RadA family phage recombinase